MTEKEVYSQMLDKLFEHLGMKEDGFSIHVASYLLGATDVIKIMGTSEAEE